MNILTELFIKTELETLCRICVIDHLTKSNKNTHKISDDTYKAYQPTLIYNYFQSKTNV